MKFSTKKFWNVTNVKDNIPRLGAAVTAGPSDEAFFAVWAQAMNVGGDPPVLQYLITIDYVAAMSEPTDLLLS